ncbi:MAG: peptidylprolyl isomerase, partial [Planctomycetota bacterium]
MPPRNRMFARQRRFVWIALLVLLIQAQPAVAQEESPPANPASNGPSTSSLPDMPTTNSAAAKGAAANPEPAEAPNLTAEEVVAEYKRLTPKDEQEAGLEILSRFEKSSAALKSKLIELRKQHTLFVNGYSDDKQAYYKLRNEARALIGETYQAALLLIEIMPHPDAARTIMTEVESRRKHDVYNEATFEGAAKMMDIGVYMLYIAQATARSAMMTGNFDIAKRVYEKLKAEDVDDIDKAMVAQADLIEKQWETEQELLKNDPKDLPKVEFKTSRGNFTVELYLNEAPSTVSHFISLVESGFYEDCDFFQVMEGLLALTGDPLGDGSSRPDKYIKDEHTRSVIRMPLAGSLVMAKLPVKGTQQFVENSGG